MCRLRLLLFWNTLLHREQRYTLLCSLALCLLIAGAPSEVLSGPPLSLSDDAEAEAVDGAASPGSWLSVWGFRSAQTRNHRLRHSSGRRSPADSRLLISLWNE